MPEPNKKHAHVPKTLLKSSIRISSWQKTVPTSTNATAPERVVHRQPSTVNKYPKNP